MPAHIDETITADGAHADPPERGFILASLSKSLEPNVPTPSTSSARESNHNVFVMDTPCLWTGFELVDR